MSSPNETHGERRPGSQMRKRLGDTSWTRVRAIASLGMVFGLGAVGTLAAWSDTATATTGMFTVSSVNVEMKLNGQHPTYNLASLSKINLARGASTAGMLPVNNTGDADFTYTAKANTSNAGTASYGSANATTFAENLTIAVFRGGSSNGTTCSGGTQLASKPLSLGTSVDYVAAHQIDAGQTDNLCFQATVSSTAPVEARMSALSIDFEFTATQA